MIRSWFARRQLPAQLSLEGTDKDFDAIYPPSIRRIAEQHFTPVSIARQSVAFLISKPGIRVLDIGSGAGKFCLIGASTTAGRFTGIEQREDLVKLSNRLAKQFNIDSVEFIHGNVMSVDFARFDAFYLFNPFFENVDPGKQIDKEVMLNPSLYQSYSAYVRTQLQQVGTGSRLVTYFTNPEIVPSGFKRVDSCDKDRLVFWEKSEEQK